ncbi:MAG TPA: TonB-dependent receptor plug domain-containing protein [Paludibacter sp.]
MRNTYRMFFLGLFFSISLISFSSNSQVPEFSQIIAKRLVKQWVNDPQEKVYLQTDKPYYSAGENIWFKAYVVDAATHQPKTLSQFIYVELIDKSNAVISRLKIKKDSLGFAGFIKLKPELSSGSYALRAYTYWMQNASTDFFFCKNIYIGNAIDDYVTSQISYGKTINYKTPVSLVFTDASHNPISGKSVDVIENWDINQKKKITLITNKEGKINWLLSIDSTDHSMKIIDASIDEPGFKYKNRYFLPEFSNDFDVQFFPESGTLLNNNMQIVAFKAIGADGLSVDVTGKIFSDKNEEVAEFSSINKGMGKFTLESDSGVNYYALVKSTKGIEKRFNLPASQYQGIALHLVFNRGKLLYEVKNSTLQKNNELFLLIHSRGRMLITQRLNDLAGQISEVLLPPGILSLSVIDSIGNTYCERLCFIPGLVSPTVTMATDKPFYGKRKPVEMNLNIQSASGKPCLGSFSISVTDSRTVKLDSLSDNILSYLLLSSDIKGYIEDPASYLSNNLNLTRERVDILMLTQGWRRFNTADIVKGIYKQPKYYLEGGQALSGKVINVFNKPSKNCGIIMFSPYKSLIKLAQTDSLGRYLIDGIEFPDSTSFILKAKKSKTFGDVEVIPDPDEFPKSTVFIPVQKPENSTANTDYFQQSKEKYYTDGGMRVVNLAGVTIKGTNLKKKAETHYYSGMEDNKMTAEKLADYPGYTIFEILTMIPGIQVNGDQVTIRGAAGNPLFLIDDIESTSMEDITYLTTNDIEEISVFKGAGATMFGSRGGNGVVAIALKKGVVRQAETPISMITITPLGYQKPSEFYVPKYNIDSVRLNTHFDLRTTIYWNPKLVSDSTGTVHVKFYTADKENNYSIVLEGVSNKGEICRYVGMLRREGN